MVFMGDKQLTGNDIRDIIKICGDSGVSMFKYGKLEIRFGSSQSPAREIPESIPQFQEVEAAALLDGEAEIREGQLEEMIVSDPVQFEELMKQNELEDAGIKDIGTESEV